MEVAVKISSVFVLNHSLNYTNTNIASNLAQTKY